MLWSTQGKFVVGSRVPFQKRGPRRTVRASFPAYSSSTALSAVLTPVLPLQRKPFANVTSLIHLIAESEGAEPQACRSLSSCPALNLKCRPTTTAPRGSLHPFGSGQILNPYATRYRPPFACSIFSYPLVQQFPLRVTCRGLDELRRWQTIGLTVFRVKDTSRLGSAYSPAVTLSACPEC
jgi:hypothetical protein